MNIVNIVPLEGGFCLVMQPNSKQTDFDHRKTIHLITLHRLFELCFETSDEAQAWFNAFQMVLTNQIKSQSFKKQVRDQEKALSNMNKVAAYNDIQQDLVDKLSSAQNLLISKQKIENENYQEIEHLDLMLYQTQITDLLQKIGQTY